MTQRCSQCHADVAEPALLSAPLLLSGVWCQSCLFGLGLTVLPPAEIEDIEALDDFDDETDDDLAP